MPRIAPRLRRPVPIAVLLLVAAACTGSASSVAPSTTGPPPTAEPTTTTAPLAPAPATSDLLVVIDGDGNIVTMRPDGSDVNPLTEGADERLRFTQPTWSPDGSRVAWTEVDGRSDDVATALVTATVAGDRRTRADVGFPPFYLYWDPTSTQLAYLGTGASQLEMGILDVAGGGDTPNTVDQGQPYYFAWAPDGSELLVHVGAGRLQWMTPTGETTDVGPNPGRFPAPDWSSDRIAYAATDGARQYLAVADRAGGDETRIAEFDGFASFLLSPDGSQIAYQTFSGPGGDQGVTAAGPGVLAAGELQAQAGGGGLSVADTRTGRSITLTSQPELAFFWSPAGDRLLSLGREPGAAPGVLRWRVWEGDDGYTAVSFIPTPTFVRDYLPFFDQYAHSMSLWSPDGSAFAYAATGAGGRPGIWVLDAVEGADAVRIGDGSFVAWSPG